MKITYDIEELRAQIDKLWSWRINVVGKGHDEVVISKDDVLNVLFGDRPEKMR